MESEQRDNSVDVPVPTDEVRNKRSSDELKLLPQKVLQLADEQELGSLWWIQRYHFSLKRSGQKDFVFEHGIIKTSGFLLFRTLFAVYHWRDVLLVKDSATEYMRYDRDIGSVYSQYTRVHDMRFGDGTTSKIVLAQPGVRTWDRDFFRYGKRSDYAVSQAERVTRLLNRKIAEAQYERIREMLLAGDMASFGRITATLDGIQVDGQSILWHAINQVRFHMPMAGTRYELAERLHVKVERLVFSLTFKSMPEGTGMRSFDIPSSDLDNIGALEKLVKVMTSQSPLKRVVDETE